MRKRLLFLATLLFTSTIALVSCNNDDGEGNPRKDEMKFDNTVFSFGDALNYEEIKEYSSLSMGTQFLFYIKKDDAGDYSNLSLGITSSMMGYTTPLPTTRSWTFNLTGKAGADDFAYTNTAGVITSGKVVAKKIGSNSYEIDLDVTFSDGKKFSAYYNGSLDDMD